MVIGNASLRYHGCAFLCAGVVWSHFAITSPMQLRHSSSVMSQCPQVAAASCMVAPVPPVYAGVDAPQAVSIAAINSVIRYFMFISSCVLTEI